MKVALDKQIYDIWPVGISCDEYISIMAQLGFNVADESEWYFTAPPLISFEGISTAADFVSATLMIATAIRCDKLTLEEFQMAIAPYVLGK